MLIEWSISNFKSIGQLIKLPLAPLTIFVGPNSSGKSTILQSILTVAQTMAALPSKRSLILNGDLTRLGFVDDVLHEGMEETFMDLGFVIQPYQSWNKVENPKAQDSGTIQVSTRFIRKDDRIQQGGNLALYEASFSQGNQLRIKYHKVDNSNGVAAYTRQINLQKILPELEKEIGKGRFDFLVDDLLPKQEDMLDKYKVHLSINHFLPDRMLEVYNATQENLRSALRTVADYFSGRISEDGLQSVSNILVSGRDGEPVRTAITRATDRAVKRMRGEITIQEIKMAERFLTRFDTLEEWATEVKKQYPRSASSLSKLNLWVQMF